MFLFSQKRKRFFLKYCRFVAAPVADANTRRQTAEMPRIPSPALLLAAALVTAQAALPPPPAAPEVTEMTELFDRLCLRLFPDNAALNAAARDYKRMTAAQVRQYLHDDPGWGWYLTTAMATYAITIEAPPYRACAVRRMTPSGFATLRPYLDAVEAYAATRRPAILRPPIEQTGKTPDGADITAFARQLYPRGATRPTEAFMMLMTDYHGTFRGDLAQDAAGGAGIEIRLVHQFVPPQ